MGISVERQEWISASHPPPIRLTTEGILVTDARALQVWVEKSPNSDLTRDFIDATPYCFSGDVQNTEFWIGKSESQNAPRSLAELVNGESWSEKLVSLNPVGKAIPPREEEGPVEVWERMLGQATLHSSRIEIVDRYLFNNFRNFRTGESPLEQILSECLDGYSGEIRFHCGRLEDVKYSYENAVRRLHMALPVLKSGKQPSVSFRLCSGSLKGRNFAHDRWIYFSFNGGPGVMYSLGKGIEDIHGSLDVRLLSEHLAPSDWTKLDAQIEYLVDSSASARLNQMLSQSYSSVRGNEPTS